MTTLTEKLHALGTVFDLVGEFEYVDVIAQVTMAYEASGYKDTAEARDCEREIDLACAHTASLLGQVKAAETLLDVVSPYWRDLVILWSHKQTRLHIIWDPVIELLGHVFSATTANAEFVVVQDDPAAPEFVAVLHMLSEKDANLRLMFMEAEDPDTVYVGTITNESALDAMLAPYSHSHWRGNEILTPEDEGGFVVTEFWVYVLGGRRIFRTHGYVCACDKGAIEVLKTGNMLPVVASTRVASVVRLTFSLQAMTDPHFRDFLRGLGGSPVSRVSWDIPMHEEADVEDILRTVEHGFEYPVQIYEVVDSWEQNVYAHTKPESQVVRILSGQRVGTTAGACKRANMDDIYDYVTTLLPETNGAGRHVLEHVLGACTVKAHAVVVRVNELETGSIPEMFAARTEAEPAATMLLTGGRYPILITESAL